MLVADEWIDPKRRCLRTHQMLVEGVSADQVLGVHPHDIFDWRLPPEVVPMVDDIDLIDMGAWPPSLANLLQVLPEIDVHGVRKWAAARVPERARHQVRVEVETSDRALTIIERRIPWREDFGPEWSRFPIARLRYTKSRGEWTLYWRDRHLKFHRYELMEPTADVSELLAEIDRNETGIFWG